MDRQWFAPVHEPLGLPTFPGSGETDTIDAIEQVQAIWRTAELEHHALRAKRVRVLDSGDRAAPEFLKGPVQPRRIQGIRTEKDIRVASQTRMAVLNDRLSTDDKVPHPMRAQQREEIEKILVKRSGAHLRRDCGTRRRGGLEP